MPSGAGAPYLRGASSRASSSSASGSLAMNNGPNSVAKPVLIFAGAAAVHFLLQRLFAGDGKRSERRRKGRKSSSKPSEKRERSSSRKSNKEEEEQECYHTVVTGDGAPSHAFENVLWRLRSSVVPRLSLGFVPPPITLNVFDFDGTLFQSPLPDSDRWDRETYALLYAMPSRRSFEALIPSSEASGAAAGDTDSAPGKKPDQRRGGLAWFQDPLTLSPPFLPWDSADFDPEAWFVMPVVEAVRRSMQDPHSVTGWFHNTNNKRKRNDLLSFFCVCFSFFALRSPDFPPIYISSPDWPQRALPDAGVGHRVASRTRV
jgi:hypothetical protein